ncbi:hypothetical protein CGCSCA4_v013614 [Colletotrichum siamense]|uniref:Uncharacterized protein n=1 Tax=Colletotrichum siamense TaxID=690259 RepID=A0A9P5EQI9_COLSI|nr:hypothetical protein CGCSCA4_v013614 [Colletotrichum siamense]KAF4857770.1 hypothetical protein CGCSCA2_v007832 [Colletotrichum siamense]
MFPNIVLVAFFATVTNAKGACYVPNGIDRHSLSNIGDNDAMAFCLALAALIVGPYVYLMNAELVPKSLLMVLEVTQQSLAMTIQKLYTMIRNGEPWIFEEPAASERGSPSIHGIASNLGCILSRDETGLPTPVRFPEDESDLTRLTLLLNARNSSSVHDAEDRVAVESSSEERGYDPEHVEATWKEKVPLDPTQFLPTYGMEMPFPEGIELGINVIEQEDEPTINDVFGPVIF